MLGLMARQKDFGMFVILGWERKWQKYADTADVSQDIFAQHHVNIMDMGAISRKKDSIADTIEFDGAVLVDDHGNALHSGAIIEGLFPRATARKINPRGAADLSVQFGFKQKVHMRHVMAITSSYFFANTTVFTISEETNEFHIFENGKILYSTVPGEGWKWA